MKQERVFLCRTSNLPSMKKIFISMIAVSVLISCKKDTENTPSKTTLLTAKNWRMSAYSSTTTVTVMGSTPITTTTEQDEYASLKPCVKDNFMKFNTDKTLVEDEGTDKCLPNSEQKQNYTWEFDSNQTVLLTKPVGSTYVYKDDIVDLSATTLRLRNTISYTAGNRQIISVTLSTFTAF